MSYIVVYQKSDDSSGVEECGDLDLAIVTAERLRNVDSVERPRIFKTEEIRYDFRPYYRVEVEAETESEPLGSTLSPPPPPLRTVVGDASTEEASESEFIESEPDERTAHASPLSAVLSGEATVDDLPPAPSMPIEEVVPDDPFIPSEELVPPTVPHSPDGLFGKPMSSETADLSDVLDEEIPEVEAQAPRRGLFGR